MAVNTIRKNRCTIHSEQGLSPTAYSRYSEAPKARAPAMKAMKNKERERAKSMANP
jgi:hypothetical protein